MPRLVPSVTVPRDTESSWAKVATVLRELGLGLAIDLIPCPRNPKNLFGELTTGQLDRAAA